MISFTPDSNKRRVAWLPEHLVTALILGQMDREFVQVAQPINLPKSVKVVTVFTEPTRRAWGVVLHSEEWENVPHGVELPEVRVQFEVMRLARRGFDVFFQQPAALSTEIRATIASAVITGERLRLPNGQAKELASRLQWLEMVALAEGPNAEAHVKAWDALVELVRPVDGPATGKEGKGDV